MIPSSNRSFRSAWAAIAALSLATQVQADAVITAEQRNALGIDTSPLVEKQIAKEYPATAQVLDAAPLIVLLRDLRAAQAAARASKSELGRAEQLHAADANVSTKALESARVQALTDTGRVDGLRAQLLTAWGPALASMSDEGREKLAADLLGNRAVLVRAETRQSGNQTDRAPLRAGRVRLLAEAENLAADVLGQAAGGGQTIGRAYLLRVASSTLQAGQVLEAELQDPKQLISGIVVPRSAIVRWQGETWVYTEGEQNHFMRTAIRPTQWIDAGCLVQMELKAGQKVVTTGSSMLLAIENSPAEKATEEKAQKDKD